MKAAVIPAPGDLTAYVSAGSIPLPGVAPNAIGAALGDKAVVVRSVLTIACDTAAAAGVSAGVDITPATLVKGEQCDRGWQWCVAGWCDACGVEHGGRHMGEAGPEV